MLGDISPGKLVFSRPPGGVAVAGPGLGPISGLRPGRWSHSARGANEHDPPTFSTAKWLYSSHGDVEDCPSFQSSLLKCKTIANN